MLALARSSLTTKLYPILWSSALTVPLPLRWSSSAKESERSNTNETPRHDYEHFYRSQEKSNGPRSSVRDEATSRLRQILDQMSSTEWSQWAEKVLQHERMKIDLLSEIIILSDVPSHNIIPYEVLFLYGNTPTHSVKSLREALGKSTPDFSWLKGRISYEEMMRLERLRRELIDSFPEWKERFLNEDPFSLKIARENVSPHTTIYMRCDEIQRKNDPNYALPAVPQNPKYPVVLAHGAGGDSGFGLLKYFTGIKEDLEGLGICVAQFRVENYGTISKRANTLAKQVREFQLKTRAPKVNLIAHSMGGLDSRFFITHVQGHEIVSSLFTISSPHRGSSYADWALARYAEPLKLEALIDYLGVEFHAYPQLTTKFLKESFNPQTPDHPDVKYYSIAGAARMPRYHVLNWSGTVVERLEGPNDGLVSVDSAVWGTFLGTIPLNHAEQIGWSTTIDPRPLYRKIMNYLASEGH